MFNDFYERKDWLFRGALREMAKIAFAAIIFLFVLAAVSIFSSANAEVLSADILKSKWGGDSCPNYEVFDVERGEHYARFRISSVNGGKLFKVHSSEIEGGFAAWDKGNYWLLWLPKNAKLSDVSLSCYVHPLQDKGKGGPKHILSVDFKASDESGNAWKYSVKVNGYKGVDMFSKHPNIFSWAVFRGENKRLEGKLDKHLGIAGKLKS